MSDNEFAEPTEHDEDGNHPADNIKVDNLHFNVLKLVRQAVKEYVKKFAGKTPKYLYAPEPFLYLIDQAVKARAAVAGTLDVETLRRVTVTQVFGVDLVISEGTCFTLTAEPLHTEEQLPQLVPTNGDLPN